MCRVRHIQTESAVVSHGFVSRVSRAFSLAEMMIALTILGIGLLIIGAALPIAVMKTRETSEAAVGDAAVEYALDSIEMRLRLPKDNADNPVEAPQRDSLFRPRAGSGALAEDASGERPWEPWIKVRPLVTAGLSTAETGSGGDKLEVGQTIADVGQMIEHQVHTACEVPGIENRTEEVFAQAQIYPDGVGLLPPAVGTFDCVFPAVTADKRPTWQDFLDDPDERQPVRWPGGKSADNDDGTETLKVLERRVGWVAFYRRASYLPAADPSLYEFVVVAVQRPTLQHSFPLVDQDEDWEPNDPQFGEEEALLPVPVLVTFTEFDWLDDTGSTPDYELSDPNRPILTENFTERPTLAFRCKDEVGRLLPKGSVFLPATNGYSPSSAAGATQVSGFVPAAPDSLPIYRVIESKPTDDGYELIVENPGFYPWVDPDLVSNVADRPGYWPVWVIPPSFTERDGDGQPVFEGRSPILSIGRRTMRLSEVE